MNFVATEIDALNNVSNETLYSNDKNEREIRYIKNLLALRSNHPEDAEEACYYGISFDRKVLEDMINLLPDEVREYASISDIDVYEYINIINEEEREKATKIFKSPNKVIGMLVKLLGDTKFCSISKPIYAYNHKVGKYKYKQVLLATDTITNKMERNGICDEPIQLDMFYEETIING